MSYNFTYIVSNSTTYLEIVQRVNSELMFGWLGTIILLTIGLISLFAFIQSTDNNSKSFAAASFIAFGLCLLLRGLELVSDYVLFTTLIIAAGAAAIAIRKR